MENRKAKGRWKTAGIDPGVHEYYNRVPRTERTETDEPVAYFLTRHDTAIQKHADEFKRQNPERTKKLTDDEFNALVRTGATKAILMAKNPNEIQARYRNCIYGALQKATTAQLKEEANKTKLHEIMKLTPQQLLLKAIFEPETFNYLEALRLRSEQKPD